MKRQNVGSSFDDWLREEGIYEEVVTAAIKRVLGRAAAAVGQHADVKVTGDRYTAAVPKHGLVLLKVSAK